MAVSREQVVQIIKGVVASPYVDQVQDFIADLEATIAEQAKEIERLNQYQGCKELQTNQGKGL